MTTTNPWMHIDGPSNLIRQILKEAADRVGFGKSLHYSYLANQDLPLSRAADLAQEGLQFLFLFLKA